MNNQLAFLEQFPWLLAIFYLFRTPSRNMSEHSFPSNFQATFPSQQRSNAHMRTTIFLSTRGHSPKSIWTKFGGLTECTSDTFFQAGITLFHTKAFNMSLVLADTHIYQPDENTISSSHQIYLCGTPILRNTSVGCPWRNTADQFHDYSGIIIHVTAGRSVTISAHINNG